MNYAPNPGHTLKTASAADAVLDYLSSEAPVAMRAEWLESFSSRALRADEVALLVRGLRARMLSVDLVANQLRGPLIDVCGTGGDRLGLFNISTTVAFVAAGAGAVVAKHGNRAITSRSGTADVLEKLGVTLELTPQSAAQHLHQRRFAFLFAPSFHPAFRSIGPVRKALAERGVPTIFNILGPMLNPVRPRRQLIGVHNPALAKLVAETCAHFDFAEAWVVCGSGGEGGTMDEVSICGTTQVWEVKGGQVREWQLSPGKAGLSEHPIEALLGGTADENAAELLALLRGEGSAEKKDAVIFNTAAALVVSGMVTDLREGVERARASIMSGGASAVLESVRTPEAETAT